MAEARHPATSVARSCQQVMMDARPFIVIGLVALPCVSVYCTMVYYNVTPGPHLTAVSCFAAAAAVAVAVVAKYRPCC